MRIAPPRYHLGRATWPETEDLPELLLQPKPSHLAPKPAYAIRYWQAQGLVPQPVDVMAVIERRANRYYRAVSAVKGTVRLADGRVTGALQPEHAEIRFSWVITSPPYYGTRTYIPDQWLGNWFVGGPEGVDYSNLGQVLHSSLEQFAA